MKKNLDQKGRFRDVIVSFRMSQAESDLLNKRVRLSGLTKQDYLIKRCFEKDIVVVGSPRIYKALRDELFNVLEELKKITSGDSLDNELLEIIQLMTTTLNGMQNKNSYPKR